MKVPREFRFVIVVEDVDAAARLYREVFGLEVLMELDEDGGRGIILKVPAATLELADAEHGAIIDQIEAGKRTGDRVRVAVEVEDLDQATEAVVEAGAQPLADPVDTPWGDRNRRFRTKDGVPLTLYQPSGVGELQA
jgi:catechol 2,3-dioxygenase-like lactoylglutathione lyase family enzyme